MKLSSFKGLFAQVLYALVVIAVICVAGAYAAKPETQTREAGIFNKLHFDGAYTVFLTQGENYSVKIEADPKLLAKITTEVKNGTLKVDTKDHGWFGCNKYDRKDVKVYITIKELKGIEIDGSAELKGEGKFTGDTIDLSVAGSGDIEMEVEAKLLDTGIAGSGDIVLRGKASEFKAGIAGSGDIKAFGLSSEKCEVSIAGSGDCQVTAAQELEISIAGSGDVTYKGNPTKLKTSVSGSGDITKAE
jgi:hypothetical protein